MKTAIELIATFAIGFTVFLLLRLATNAWFGSSRTLVHCAKRAAEIAVREARLARIAADFVAIQQENMEMDRRTAEVRKLRKEYGIEGFVIARAASGKIELRFAHPIAWLSMQPRNALAAAQGIIEAALETGIEPPEWYKPQSPAAGGPAAQPGENHGSNAENPAVQAGPEAEKADGQKA